MKYIKLFEDFGKIRYAIKDVLYRKEAVIEVNGKVYIMDCPTFEFNNFNQVSITFDDTNTFDDEFEVSKNDYDKYIKDYITTIYDSLSTNLSNSNEYFKYEDNKEKEYFIKHNNEFYVVFESKDYKNLLTWSNNPPVHNNDAKLKKITKDDFIKVVDNFVGYLNNPEKINESISGVEMVGDYWGDLGKTTIKEPIDVSKIATVYVEEYDSFYTYDEFCKLYNDYMKNGGKSIEKSFNKKTILNILNSSKQLMKESIEDDYIEHILTKRGKLNPSKIKKEDILDDNLIDELDNIDDEDVDINMEEIIDFIYDLNTENNRLKIYRGINLDEGYKDYDGSGVCWTLDKSQAFSDYTDKNSQDYIVLCGLVNLSDVDWYETIYHYSMDPEWQEIRVKTNSDIQLLSIYKGDEVYRSYKDIVINSGEVTFAKM